MNVSANCYKTGQFKRKNLADNTNESFIILLLQNGQIFFQIECIYNYLWFEDRLILTPTQTLVDLLRVRRGRSFANPSYANWQQQWSNKKVDEFH